METVELKAHPRKARPARLRMSDRSPIYPGAADAMPRTGRGLYGHCHAGKLVLSDTLGGDVGRGLRQRAW
jgi:hypothetical protein